MFEKIKRLGTDTAIYGVGTILGRFLTFLLTPVYANLLPPSDLGTVATVFAYIAFLNVVYGYGMESAYLKYASTLESGSKKQTFSVPFLSVGATSLMFSGVVVWSCEPLAEMIGLPVVHHPVVSYAAWILCLDAVAVVPLACLRLERKALRFATIKLTNIVVNVCCTVVFLLVYRMGVEGIFLSGVISSAVTLVLLIPTIASNLTLRLTGGLYASLLKFGLPYVPAGLATMMVQVIDRPILESLTDTATVGIYQANYRLGIFMMLIVSMYDFAWRPFFLLHAKDPDARELFARVLTYFVLLMTCVFLVLCFFLEGIIRAPVFFGRSILPEPYWEGFTIVPVILLAYMFLGVSTNLSAGMYIEKKTQHLPYITFAGAFINVVANFLLIPPWGIMGAAIATLLSYAAMAVILFFVVQRFYPVRYEFERIAKIALAAGIVFVLSEVVSLKSFEFGWKLFLLGTFGALVYWMKFFKPTEMGRIASLFTRRTPLSQPPDIVQGPEG